MSQFGADKIKNVALLGHAGSGKTTLAEALLFKCGAIDRQGKVLDGNTASDFDAEEIKRRASLSVSVLPLIAGDIKVNLLDAPGLFDFAAGTCEALGAADSAIIAVSAKSGVSVGAKKAYKQAAKAGKAKLVFVGKMDSENADFYKVLEDLKANFGPSVCPIVVPFVENRKVQCYINLLEMQAYQYDAKGGRTQVDMPNTEHRLDGLIAAISEAVAETDEELFEKYFSGEPFTYLEMVSGLRSGIKAGTITPVLCGSAADMAAIDLLLSAIEMLPSASAAAPMMATGSDGERKEVSVDASAPTSAYVFKTVADPFVGKLSFIKVIGGTVTMNSALVNQTSGQSEKPGKLLLVRGKKQEDVKEIVAGDIGALTKLDAQTGDTLCDPKAGVKFEPIEFPEAGYAQAIKVDDKIDDSKMANAINRLLEEDRSLRFEINKETHQQILSGLGDQHLDVTLAKLNSKFGIQIELEDPRVAYRETIRKKVEAEGKHKKQTGGHGQYGHVVMTFEPCDEPEVIFETKVVGGSVPKGYFPAVEKGIRESALRGVLAGYPVVGLKATLMDGSYHPVDSSEIAFKTAASLAYKDGLAKASPILLEPIGLLKAAVPDDKTGDLMGDLNKRRGRVLGMNPGDKGETIIEANVPMAEMQDFTTTLRQMSQGAGSFTLEFERYEPLPDALANDVIANAPGKER